VFNSCKLTKLEKVRVTPDKSTLSKRSKVANQYPVMTNNQGLEKFEVGLLDYTLQCYYTVASRQAFEKIGRICFLCISLELACNGGSCGGLISKRGFCDLHLQKNPSTS